MYTCSVMSTHDTVQTDSHMHMPTHTQTVVRNLSWKVERGQGGANTLQHLADRLPT